MGKGSFILGMSAAFGLLALAFASAMETKVGNLEFKDVRIRATIATAKVSAGYLSITNNSDEDDRLIGATAEFAGKTQVHEMKMNNDVMEMRHLENGLAIPAGETVTLKPGAEHLMFMQLSQPMNEGEGHMITLEFEKAGQVKLHFPVGNLGGEATGHGDHSHGGGDDSHNHSNHNN